MIIVHFTNFIQRVIKNSEDDFYHVIHGCRHCGYAGNLHRHASYHRTIICKEITTSVKIQRVICPNCNKTHALIPSDIIPYFQHTLETILNLLELIKIKKDSYSKVIKEFKNFNLSLDLGHLYLYIKRFTSNLDKTTYYFRVYCDIFLEPTASEADVISKLKTFQLSIFNCNYFNKMPSYFLSKVINI